jgi:hypothetical protein
MKSFGVSLRLSKDVYIRYATEAHVKSLSLAALLRSYLENQDRLLQGEIADLRRGLEQVAAASASTGKDEPAMRPAVLEMLLLLRSLAGPQRALMTQKEVERRGLETWR